MIAHGRFFGNGRASAAADVIRIEDGTFAEHWDMIENEATKAQSLGACRSSSGIGRGLAEALHNAPADRLVSPNSPFNNRTIKFSAAERIFTDQHQSHGAFT